MKQIFFLFFALLCLNAVAQKDTSKVDTGYAVILAKSEFDWLINLIKSQDEKPSLINQQIQAIYQKTQLVVPKSPPNKEGKKKWNPF